MTSHCGKTSASCITCSEAALGEWDIPVGEMGSVTAALPAAAAGHGAENTTAANVYAAIDPNGAMRYRSGDEEHLIRGRFILAGGTPGGSGRACWANPRRDWPRGRRSR